MPTMSTARVSTGISGRLARERIVSAKPRSSSVTTPLPRSAASTAPDIAGGVSGFLATKAAARPEGEADLEEVLSVLLDVLQREPCRRILSLRMQGKERKAIAEELGLSVDQLRRRLTHIRRTAARVLERMGVRMVSLQQGGGGS